MDIIWSSTISGMINVNACTIYLMHVSGSWESILEINPEWNIYVDLIVELVEFDENGIRFSNLNVEFGI